MNTKGVMIGLIVAAVAAISLEPTTAEALPGQEVERFYYSNASMTNQVGYRLVLSCFGGGSGVIGTATNNYVTTSTPCSGTGSGEVDCYVNGHLTTCPPSICDSQLFEC